MSARRDSLTPPARTGTNDPGARELESSESDDHFSDAQSAPESPSASPIPKLRVEKIDDEPSYGEVPGTEAYKLREGDAEPDEIAIIIDEKNKTASSDAEADRAKSPTPGGHPIPKTVVEESAGNTETQSHPEKKYKADAPADLVLAADDKAEGQGSATDTTPISPALTTPNPGHKRRKSSVAMQSSAALESDDDDDFGDDFDDFEEGDEDAGFDDFDDGFEEPTQEPYVPALAPAPSQAPAVQPLSFPIPDFNGMDSDDIFATTESYMNALYPTEEGDEPALPSSSKDNPIFLTPRSASLWSQLVAPPPLQPPDWIRSRIRRLFLVSLGVPVDLDEILPASKQKKLILPSLHNLESSDISRLKQSDGNNSTTSIDSQGRVSSASKPRKGPPPEPDLDLVAAKQLCTTTDEALDGMTDQELHEHIEKMKKMEITAKEVLEYWKKRTDEKIGDREAFEGVIENLVMHARKTRK